MEINLLQSIESDRIICEEESVFESTRKAGSLCSKLANELFDVTYTDSFDLVLGDKKDFVSYHVAELAKDYIDVLTLVAKKSLGVHMSGEKGRYEREIDMFSLLDTIALDMLFYEEVRDFVQMEIVAKFRPSQKNLLGVFVDNSL